MNRNILARVLTVVAAAFVVFLSGDANGQGEGLLNQVDVSDSRSLDLIKEVLAFNAFEPDPKTGTIKFAFDFADVEHNTGISPTLIISRDGKRVAHVRPEVFFVEAGVMRKTPYNMIEFDLSPEFVRDSALMIQFFPNTEKLVTYKIGLVAATVLTHSRQPKPRALAVTGDFLLLLSRSTCFMKGANVRRSSHRLAA